VATLAFLFAETGTGSPVYWNLTGTFTDGGTLTGWFEFDSSATTDSSSAYALTVSGGNTSVFPAFTYTPSNSFWGGGFYLSELIINDLADERELTGMFSSNLTDASSSPNTLSGTELFPLGGGYRDFSGSATSEIVPEPGTLADITTGLASMLVSILLWRKARMWRDE
jgi:hypothetical protein